MGSFAVTVVLFCRKMGETQYYTLSLRYKQGTYFSGGCRNPGCFSVRWAVGNMVHPLWANSFKKLPFGRVNGEKNETLKGQCCCWFPQMLFIAIAECTGFVLQLCFHL